MKKVLLLGLVGAIGLLAFFWYASSRRPAAALAARPAASASDRSDDIFTYPPPAAQALPPVVAQPALAAYLRTVPTQIQAAAKKRNVVFMPDCLTGLTTHVQQFSAEGQRDGLTLAQIQDNNGAFINLVVSDLRNEYDKGEQEEHKNDPRNPLTGKSLREEAEIYTCGLKNYLPLFNNLMAAKPVVTILTQPNAANVFLALPSGYRSLGISRLSKTIQSGLYTLVFTKPGYQSIRKTFASQRIPAQVFRVTLPPVAAAR